MKTEKNSARYRDMSVPYESHEAASKAIDAFYEELNEIRAKHRIADLTVVIAVNYNLASGDETTAMCTAHIGDGMKHLAHAAFMYGEAKRGHEEMLGGWLAKRTKT